uniref:Uncharacterized protein n=1 Tax=Panagrolaimus sp. ES5 TaxID=591445 RepID=A0AC34GNK3_9BILA
MSDYPRTSTSAFGASRPGSAPSSYLISQNGDDHALDSTDEQQLSGNVDDEDEIEIDLGPNLQSDEEKVSGD